MGIPASPWCRSGEAHGASPHTGPVDMARAVWMDREVNLAFPLAHRSPGTHHPSGSDPRGPRGAAASPTLGWSCPALALGPLGMLPGAHSEALHPEPSTCPRSRLHSQASPGFDCQRGLWSWPGGAVVRHSHRSLGTWSSRAGCLQPPESEEDGREESGSYWPSPC